MIRNLSNSLSFILIWLLSCSSPSVDSTVRIRIDQDPESLHPISYSNAIALQFLNLTYQSLLTIDLKDKSIKPLLASALPEVVRGKGGSQFTYVIRPEARWANGQPVTASDIVFSLKLLHSPLLDNEQWRAQYDFVEDVKVSSTNPLEVKIYCKGYNPEMKLLTGDFFIVPAYQYDPENKLSTIPFKQIKQKFDSLSQTNTFKNLAHFISQPSFSRDVTLIKGSGPYEVKSWNSGQALLLEKKRNWWGDNLSNYIPQLQAKPERIIFQIIPDNAAAVLALKANQVDLMDNIPLESFLQIKKDSKYSKQFNFFTPTSYNLVFIGLNGGKSILQDRQTRIALGYLVNTPQIIKSLQGGLATPTIGFVHPQDEESYNSSQLPFSLNKQKAKSMLLEAGWQQTANGWQRIKKGQIERLKLELLYRAGNTDYENIGILFQQNAKSIGIEVTLAALESSQVTNRISKRNYDLYLRTLEGNPFSYNLLPLLHTSNAIAGGANVTNFGTPETDSLLEKIATEEEYVQKSRLLRTLQQKMLEESNLIYLYFEQNKIAISKDIDSVVVSGIKPGYDVTKFIKKK